MSNAIDALEERTTQQKGIWETLVPQIRISTELTPAQQVVICIANNGTDISGSDQKRIFDPFFTTKPIGQGTGMGLAVSDQIITQNHGGTLGCNLAPSAGTELTIEMPISQIH